jgi:hypothetical protein
MPIESIESKIEEVRNEITSIGNSIYLNGLFLMLVSYIEAMQKEILKYYLKYNPEKIPNNKLIEINKNILSNNENFNLVEKIISEYIDNIPFWQFIKYFYDVLKIKKPSNSQIVEDIKKKRNELIHSNMRINYKQNSVSHSYITSEYLIDSIKEYSSYLAELKLEISRKYYKCTRLNALRNLWYYTFVTPLCKNFEDYWHIDNDKDAIFAIKKPDYESGLSHSETFLLGIWRSQVTSGKVDFLNIASLDDNTQSKLYMFLKLSNDIFLY